MGTFGLGHDVVDVAAFVEQLSEPGSRMLSLFSVREVRQAADRARLKNDDEAVHLAAKWAGKEAFLKAWCDYLGDAPYPFTLDNFPWPEIEILDDSRGVPHVSLGKGTASVFQTDYAGSIPVIRSTDKSRKPKQFQGFAAFRIFGCRIIVIARFGPNVPDCDLDSMTYSMTSS